MQTSNTWYKFHLHWYKITFIVFFLSIGKLHAQNLSYDNLWDYDEQWIHYGFLIGVHNSDYRIEYNDYFVTPAMDSVHSIIPGNYFGFKLGFVVDFYLLQYLSVRLLPTIGFYEYGLNYRFLDGQHNQKELKDATMMELPLLFKYKSTRRGNLNLYLIGGPNFQIEAAGNGDKVKITEKLELKNFNLSLELGMGCDIFYQLFKFSPEIRYSFGFRNLLSDDINDFNIGLNRLTTHNITAYVSFEGGPSYLKRRKNKL